MEVDKLLKDTIGSSGLAGLQSKISMLRLEQISSLRARGISNSIDLPQLAVCGDQSSGKSSTLEVSPTYLLYVPTCLHQGEGHLHALF